VQGYKFNIFYPDLLYVPSQYLPSKIADYLVTSQKRPHTTSSAFLATLIRRLLCLQRARRTKILRSESSEGRGSILIEVGLEVCLTREFCNVSPMCPARGTKADSSVLQLWKKLLSQVIEAQTRCCLTSVARPLRMYRMHTKSTCIKVTTLFL